MNNTKLFIIFVIFGGTTGTLAMYYLVNTSFTGSLFIGYGSALLSFFSLRKLFLNE